ncbi:MAG: hypothetical protein ACK5MQ_18090 [Pikeienuella sp.]
MSFSRKAAAAAIFLASGALPAVAQEEIGFPDSYGYEPAQGSFSVTGVRPASEIVRGCPGFAAEAPAMVMNIAEPTETPAIFYGVAAGSAGVLIADPDGIHSCAKADEFGIAPLRASRITTGKFSIWPLTVEKDATLSGVAIVSAMELSLRDLARIGGLTIDPAILPPLLSEVPLNPTAEPAAGRLTTLPEIGETVIGIEVAGLVPAEEAGPSCVGYIDQKRPDVVLTLDAPTPQLIIRGEGGDFDAMLLVVDPGGEVSCNDDLVNYDPVVAYQDAAPGDYAIWLGSIGESKGEAATLRVSREPSEEISALLAARRLNPDAEPAFGHVEMPGPGAEPTQATLSITGEIAAQSFEDDCAGVIDPTRPDIALNLTETKRVVWLSATAEDLDTTLVVRSPDGDLHCSDDFNGVDPGLGLFDAAPGRYAIWVGGYAGGNGETATLTVANDMPDDPEELSNPFAGVELTSAAQALRHLMETTELGRALSYETMEETGPEGFTLTGVALTDPYDDAPPVSVGAIRVTDLDLAGLSTHGVPERFVIAFDNVEYAALRRMADEGDYAALPALADPSPLSISVSLLPREGDETLHVFDARFSLENQVAVDLSATMRLPEGVDGLNEMSPDLTAPGTFTLKIDDDGYIGAFAASIAADMGQSRDGFVSESLSALSMMFSSSAPDSPGAKIHELIRARLSDLDRPAVMTLRLETFKALMTEELIGFFMMGGGDASVAVFETGFEPKE